MIIIIFVLLITDTTFLSFYLSDSPSPIVDESPFVIHDDLPLQVRVSEPNFDLSEENLTILPDSSSDSARTNSDETSGFYHDAAPNKLIRWDDALSLERSKLIACQDVIPSTSKAVTFKDAAPSEVVFRRDAPPSEVIHDQNIMSLDSSNIEFKEDTSCKLFPMEIILIIGFVGSLILAGVTFPHFYDILSRFPPKG